MTFGRSPSIIPLRILSANYIQRPFRHPPPPPPPPPKKIHDLPYTYDVSHVAINCAEQYSSPYCRFIPQIIPSINDLPYTCDVSHVAINGAEEYSSPFCRLIPQIIPGIIPSTSEHWRVPHKEDSGSCYGQHFYIGRWTRRLCNMQKTYITYVHMHTCTRSLNG